MNVYSRDYLRILKRIYWPGKHDTPLQLILFITSNCNARCRHCFYWKSLEENTDLAFSEIEKVSLSLGDLFSLSISGGEPFLSPFLAETCLLFERNNAVRRIQIPTNGLLPDSIAQVTEEILQRSACELTIALSIDGLEKTNDYLRGRAGNFQNSRESYLKLGSLKERYPRLRLVTNTVISAQNVNEIEPLFALLRREWPELDSVNWDWLRGSSPSPEVRLPALSECRDLKDTLLKTKQYFLREKTGRLRTILEMAIRDYLFDVNMETLERKKQVIPCLADRTYMVIYASGDCSFCEMLSSFGNIREKSLPDLLIGPEADRLRKIIRGRKCFCTHGCNQPYNVIFNPRNYPGILRRLGRHYGTDLSTSAKY